jgi:hypothetical protein
MPDDMHVIRGINWRETFPFTNIFRSFRVAIHPSKLILALLAILLLYCGGRLLDGLWPSKWRAVPNEVGLYERVRANRGALADLGARNAAGDRDRTADMENLDFDAAVNSTRQQIQDRYAETLVEAKVEKEAGKPLTPDQAKEAAANRDYLGALRDQIIKERDRRAGAARLRYDLEKEAAEEGVLPQVDAAIDGNPAAVDPKADEKARTDGKAKVRNALDDAKKNVAPSTKDANKTKDPGRVKLNYETTVRETYARAESEWRQAKQIEGVGPWEMFLDYEVARIDNIVYGVLRDNWVGGLFEGGEPGVFESIRRFFFVGPRWAFGHHMIFFALMGILFLIIWAIFGGAIARIAAVHVAREEKLSIRQALRFSTGKFLSFVFAPVIPLVIVVVIGLVVALGGLLLYIPFIGPILVGIFYFLALAAGFVMTLVALGTAGGLNLMYPTIAVEGSDSFDAISRSFSYVYARPWRMLWYTIVAIVYGAFTYLFVRLFIWLTLGLSHRFTGMWVVRNSDQEVRVWNTLWPGSSFARLPYDIPWLSMSFGEKLAAFFIALWVFIVISFLGAYLISYYFSSSTIIYYLMRREVDATELDDVYLEQSDDEFAEPSTAAGAGAAPAAGGVATVTTAETAVVVTPGSGTSMPAAPPVEPAAPPPSEPGVPPV